MTSSKVELHNSVDVNYKFSIITNNDISPAKETSSKNYPLSESKNVPWLKGLIGCSEKCKRAIILPYSLSVSNKNVYYIINNFLIFLFFNLRLLGQVKSIQIQI